MENFENDAENEESETDADHEESLLKRASRPPIPKLETLLLFLSCPPNFTLPSYVLLFKIFQLENHIVLIKVFSGKDARQATAG